MDGQLELAGDVVHVWRVDLDHHTDAWGREYQRVLSTAEIERAASFVFDRDRRRYVVAHAALRQVLAAYMDAAPADLEFASSARGKPRLCPRPGSADWLRFNLAHSGELALIGVANAYTLGIDVEYARPMPEALAIAERFFSRAERAVLGATAGEAQQRAFFTYWTRKEAVIKATGDGLSMPLDRISVDWPGSDSPYPFVVQDLSGTRHRLRVVDLAPAPGYVAALAIGGGRWRLEQREWPGDLVA